MTRAEQRQIKYNNLQIIDLECLECHILIKGKTFEGRQMPSFCNPCRLKKQSLAAYQEIENRRLNQKEMNCRICNKQIYGFNHKPKMCQECRLEKKRSYNRRGKSNIKCVKCGIEFICHRSHRKYCSNCRARDPLPQSLIQAIFHRDNFTCQYCGQYGNKKGNRLSIDHIIPLSNEGTNEKDNLVVSCLKCNLIKGTKNVAVFKKQLSVGV